MQDLASGEAWQDAIRIVGHGVQYDMFSIVFPWSWPTQLVMFVGWGDLGSLAKGVPPPQFDPAMAQAYVQMVQCPPCRPSMGSQMLLAAVRLMLSVFFNFSALIKGICMVGTSKILHFEFSDCGLLWKALGSKMCNSPGR